METAFGALLVTILMIVIAIVFARWLQRRQRAEQRRGNGNDR